MDIGKDLQTAFDDGYKKGMDDISQWLQNNGFEEASKAIDCEFEL